MAEVFSDNFQTTLTAAVSVTTRPVTLSVAATSPDLAGGTFSIIVYDAGTDANPTNAEIMKVTDGSTTSWSATTEPGHAATTHAIGSTVRQILTKRSLTQQMVDHTNQTTTPDPHSGYIRKSTFSAKGDTLVATGSGAFAREAVGTDGTVPIADSTQPTGRRWGSAGLTGILSHLGDLVVGGVLGAAQRLGIGTPGQVLTVVVKTPVVANPVTAPTCTAVGSGGSLVNGNQYDFAYSWSTGSNPDGGPTLPSPVTAFTATSTGTVAVQVPSAPASGLTLIVYAAAHNGTLTQQGTITNPSTSTTNTINVSAIGSGAAVATTNTTGGLIESWQTPAAAGVTSVGLTVPSEFTVSGSPITGSGSFVVGKASQNAGKVYAAPSANLGNGAPGFRFIQSSDLPVMIQSGIAHAPGAVPDPPTTAGSSKFLRETGEWVVPVLESSSATVLTSSSTIAANTGLTSIRVAPTTAVNSIVLGVGSVGGQILTIVNESVSANSVQFATLATSNVATGTSCVIAGNTHKTFVWDSSTLLWYEDPTSSGTGSVFTASGTGHSSGIVPDPGAVAGTSHFLREDATWALLASQSATAPALATSGTITTSGVTAARVAPTGAVTGVILQAGTLAGQVVSVINESASANSVTMATAATSNVADGLSCVIPGLTQKTFVWDTSTSRWYEDPTPAIPTTMVASGASHAGGLVPDPGSTAGTTRFLREDATFNVPPTMVASGASHAAGYAPDPGSSVGTTRYLREDATWSTPSGSSSSSGGSGALVPIQTLTPSGTNTAAWSVPTGLKNLVITGRARSDTASNTTSLNLQFNGDSGGNYDYNYIEWLGTNTISAQGAVAQTSMLVATVTAGNIAAGPTGQFDIRIDDHASTGSHKTIISNASYKTGTTTATIEGDRFAGYWRSTAAVTSVTLTLAAGNFVAGSSLTLWGESDNPPVLLTTNSNLIQETILLSAQASIPIPILPQNYKDVRIEIFGRVSGAVGNRLVRVQFNGDTGSNYDGGASFLNFGTGAGGSSGQGQASTAGYLGVVSGASAPSNDFSSITVLIPDYADTSTPQKVAKAHGVQKDNTTASTQYATFAGTWWRSAAAITSITIFPDSSDTFVAGTAIRVYGEPSSTGGSSVGTGTRLRHSTTQAATSGTSLVLSFDTEDQDSDNQHYTSSTAISGTVAKTAGSITLVGTTTAFTTDLSVGQVISVPGTVTEQFVVVAITDNTHLTTNVAASNTASGQTATRLNSPIVFRQPGMYLVELGVYSAALASGQVTLQIRLNGSTIISQKDLTGINATAAYDLTTQRPFQQWDYVEALWTQSSGGSVNVQSDERTHFSSNARPTVIVAVPYVCIQDQKAQNTVGGGLTGATWNTRTLNTVVSDSAGIVSLASNQITLPPGTYRISASAPAFNVSDHQLRLRNITDSATLLTGGNEAAAGTSTATRAYVAGRFTLTGTKVLELQHNVTTTNATNGAGLACNFGTEVYTNVEIWKEG